LIAQGKPIPHVDTSQSLCRFGFARRNVTLPVGMVAEQ
jgi:hypothetical protein